MTQWFVFPDYTWNPLEWVHQRLNQTSQGQRCPARKEMTEVYGRSYMNNGCQRKSSAGLESLFSYHITFYKVLRDQQMVAFFVLAALRP